ncbi:hypothetical protein QFZ65_002522 [Arthrobacter sp. B3I9]|nr:hypothetical protein [Arthrobacter sp. B3I9]
MLFWACFIITSDMYDLVVYGSVLPVLMKQWSLGPCRQAPSEATDLWA